MSVLAETSALYALLVRSDPSHSAASAGFTALMKAKDLNTAFAIDPHFAEAGFDLVPRPR